jgi:hypothetical protein
MKRILSVPLVLACLAPVASRAGAQMLPGVSIAVEARPLLGMPVGDFGGAENGVGATAGYGGAVGARVGLGPLSVYGDYQAVRFGCDECVVAGLDDRALDTGWEAGVQLGVPFLPLVPVKPWVRGGLILHQLGFSGEGGTLASDQSTGFAVSAGADLPFGLGLRLSPTVGYSSYTADVHLEQFQQGSGVGATKSTPVTYVTLGVDLVYHF